MIIKYCTSDEICVALFDDVSFKDGVLTLVSANPECFSIYIKGLSSFEIHSIIDQLFTYHTLDLTRYKDKTFYVDD